MGLAGPVIDWDGVEELGAIGADPTSGRHDDDAITVFKSIGVGLEDVALAELVARRLGLLA